MLSIYLMYKWYTDAYNGCQMNASVYVTELDIFHPLFGECFNGLFIPIT